MKGHRIEMVRSITHRQLAENLVMIARTTECGAYFSSEEEVIDIIIEALDIVMELGAQKRER